MKSTEVQVKELFILHENTKKSQIKDEKQLDSLADALELLPAKFDELEKDREKKEKKNQNFNRQKLGDSVDELEQYSRGNYLLLHGARELETDIRMIS